LNHPCVNFRRITKQPVEKSHGTPPLVSLLLREDGSQC
jgi:hypothetical protein